MDAPDRSTPTEAGAEPALPEGRHRERRLELPPAQSDALAPIDPRRREIGVHRARFGLAYLALAVFAGIGVGMAVLLLDRPAERTVIWSAWQPRGSESTFDDQIAQYVASRYPPMVAILPSPTAITIGDEQLSVRNVVIQNDPQGDREGFRVVPVDTSMMYQLCGSGPRCSLGEGQATTEQLRLLRRESLELALYTFKYGDGVDTVFTLIPPDLGDPENPNDDTQVALFFERDVLKRELEQPLKQTLAGNVPQGTEVDPREDLVINRLTGNRLFLYQFQPAPAGGAVMLLARPTG